MIRFLTFLAFAALSSSLLFGQSAVVRAKLLRSNEKVLANQNVTFISTDMKHLNPAFTDASGLVEVKLYAGKKYNICFDNYEYKRLPVIPKNGMDLTKGKLIIDEFIYANVGVAITDYYASAPLENQEVHCKSLMNGKKYTVATDEAGKAKFYLPRGEKYLFTVLNQEIGEYFIKEAKGYSTYDFNLPAFAVYTEQDQEISNAWIESQRLERKRLDSLASITPHRTRVFLNSLMTDRPYENIFIYTSEEKKAKIGEVDYIWDSKAIQETDDMMLCDGSFGNETEDRKLSFWVDLTPGTYEVYVEDKKKKVQKNAVLIIEPHHSAIGNPEYKGKAKIVF